MKKIVLAAAFSACIGGCASKEAKPESWTTTRVGEDAVERVGMTTATATVEAIDPATRSITLRASQGNIFSFIAGPEVRNFDRIAKGDLVRATYYESLLIEVKAPGEAVPQASVDAGAARAPQGSGPAVAGAREVKVTAKVLAVDGARGTVTLEGPGGAVVTAKAIDPKNLEKVKAGDLLEITYTQALGIAVEKVR